MIQITQEQFKNIKTSDTLVVLGSGSSINDITVKQWTKISKWNSIGFNWFCHHAFCPTFYAIREQANSKIRNVDTETRKMLFKEMSKKTYRGTCIIIHDVSHHSKKSYSYVNHSDRFTQMGIIVRDIKKKKINKKFFTFDIFGKGVFHGNITLTNVMHIGLYLKYKKVVFVGVDLRNSQYFWLGPKKVRSNIRRAGIKNKHRHPAAHRTMSLLKLLQKQFKIAMVTANKRSYLVKIMPYMEI